MGLDHLVHLAHQPHRLFQGHDHALIVFNILRRQRPAGGAFLAAAIVQPLVQDLAAAATR